MSTSSTLEVPFLHPVTIISLGHGSHGTRILCFNMF